jgi:hypothetical protein
MVAILGSIVFWAPDVEAFFPDVGD